MPEHGIPPTRADFFESGNDTPAGMDQAEINLALAGRILMQSKKIVLGGAALGLVLAGLVSFLIKPYYTAAATFIPPSSSSSASSMIASQLGALGASGLLGGAAKSSGELYVGILQSRSVSDDMVSRFGLMQAYRVHKLSQAVKVLGQHSRFDVNLKNSIITVQVTDDSPQRASEMANAYLEEVRSKSSRLALTESSQRRLFFEDRLARAKDGLSDAEVALKQTEERTGLIAPAGQTASEIQGIAQLQAQIGSRQASLAALLQDETNDNPDVLRLKNEIGSLQGQVAARENGHQKGVLSTAQVPELALDYIRRERDVKYQETLFEIIAKQYESARLDEAQDPPLQILDRAIPPDTKAGPHRSLIMLAGFFLSSLLSSLLVLYKRTRVT